MILGEGGSPSVLVAVAVVPGERVKKEEDEEKVEKR